jgi:hypothetical protein
MFLNNNTIHSLHSKDAFNRLRLQKNWARPKNNGTVIRFGLLKLDYGDSRLFPFSEIKKENYEGLKISK